jgi:sugar phosphate isomerase/epimerase
MAIQLGTVAPIGFPDFAAADWLACFRRLGCTVVQAYRNQKARLSVRQMEDYIAAGQMPCDSLHGVFGEEFDPSGCAEPHRRFAVDSYKREGELALALGGSLVVVHCATIRRHAVPLAERKLRLRQLRKSILELGRFGEEIGVTYAFENLPGYHAIGYDVAELAGLLEELAATRTGMCFDTGHALMTGDPPQSIRAADGRIVYVHLSDNSGRSDDHEMPTYGALDCDRTAEALRDVGYHGTLMLEVFHTLDRLKEMIDEGAGERLARIVRRAEGQAAG